MLMHLQHELCETIRMTPSDSVDASKVTSLLGEGARGWCPDERGQTPAIVATTSLNPAALSLLIAGGEQPSIGKINQAIEAALRVPFQYLLDEEDSRRLCAILSMLVGLRALA